VLQQERLPHFLESPHVTGRFPQTQVLKRSGFAGVKVLNNGRSCFGSWKRRKKASSKKEIERKKRLKKKKQEGKKERKNKKKKKKRKRRGKRR